MKTRINKFRAWCLRLMNKKRLTKMNFEVEPSLFYVIVLTIAGSVNSHQEYIYLGKGLLLPTNKTKKRNHFLTISL